MKKVLMMITMAFGIMNANAQYQLTNPGFDGTWNTCTPWVGKSSSTTSGTTPTGWCVANVIGTSSGLGKTVVGTSDTDRNGASNCYSCKLTNGEYSGNVIPGYVTLGTAWNTAKGISGGNADGGSWGGISFTGTPDAIEFWYKRSVSSGSQPGSVVAYMWKGSTSQANVPANVVVIGSPTTVTMVNRDRNILGISTDQGGTVTYSSDFSLIASLMTGDDHVVNITDTPSSWTKKTCEFTYHNATDRPTMINVVFGSMDYFANRSNHTSGNTLTVDDVKLLYYSELASATYNNAAVSFTNGAATVDAEYDASKLALTSNGHGATIEKSYNEETGVLTIMVKGEDFSVDTTNYHTYTIQFNTAVAGDLDGNGVVDDEDIAAIISMIKNPATKTDAADLNGDTKVNVGDITAAVNLMLKK